VTNGSSGITLDLSGVDSATVPVCTFVNVAAATAGTAATATGSGLAATGARGLPELATIGLLSLLAGVSLAAAGRRRAALRG
jgi:hypothetical protein